MMRCPFRPAVHAALAKDKRIDLLLKLFQGALMILYHPEIISHGLILCSRDDDRVIPVAAQAFGNQPGIATVGLDAFSPLRQHLWQKP